jgi:hypothetical protein
MIIYFSLNILFLYHPYPLLTAFNISLSYKFLIKFNIFHKNYKKKSYKDAAKCKKSTSIHKYTNTHTLCMPTYIGTYVHTHEHTYTEKIWCSCDRASWHISYNKPTSCTNFSIYFGMKLYIFRTVPLPIIRSFSLYTQQWYMSYRFFWQLAWSCL